MVLRRPAAFGEGLVPPDALSNLRLEAPGRGLRRPEAQRQPIRPHGSHWWRSRPLGQQVDVVAGQHPLARAEFDGKCPHLPLGRRIHGQRFLVGDPVLGPLDRTSSDRTFVPLANAVQPDGPPGQRGLPELSRPVADLDRHLGGLARLDLEHRRGIQDHEIRAVQIGHAHPRAPEGVAILLGRTVVVDETVVLPLNVGEFGVDVPADLLVQAQFVGQVLEAPGDVLIALPGPDPAVLAVHQRLIALHVALHVIEARPREGLLDHLGDVLAGRGVVVDVEMPGVDVGDHVIVVAGRVVLHQPGRIQVPGAMVHGLDPLVPLRPVALVIDAPGLVEIHPGEHRRVHVVAGYRPLQQLLVPLGGPLVVLPEVGDVLHDQHAQAVGPVQLPRHGGLDVDAEHVDAQLLAQLVVAAHHRIAGILIDGLGVERLVQGSAQVHRLAIEGDVLVVASGSLDGRHLAKAEVGLHDVAGVLRVNRDSDVQADRVELGGLGRPQLRILEYQLELNDRVVRLAAHHG